MLSAQQKFFHLAPDPFRGQVAEIDRTTQLNRLRLDLEFKSRGELRGPQHAQAVFGEGVGRNRAQQPGLEIVAAVKWIDNLCGKWVLQDRVNGEIAAARALFDRHRRIAFDKEPAMSTSGLALATWN